MPSGFRTPRSLAAWFDLDYFRRRTLFRGWWGGLPLLAGAASLALLGLMVWAGGQRAFQAGPLSPPHALFNDRCELCHDSRFGTLSRLWRGDSVGSISDEKCLSCHAGPLHNQHAAMDRCVGCHKEHRGHAALVRIDDRKCVACHADLKREDGSPPERAAHVTAFSQGRHPEFRVREDPATVRFNHQYHLVDLPRYREALAAKDDEGARRRLRSLGAEPLTCAGCHRMDDDGRYMRPVSYNDHCRRCHPLSVGVQGEWPDKDLGAAAARFAEAPLRHPRGGETAAVVRADLRDRLTTFIQGPQGRRFLDAVPPAKPGRRLPWPPPDAARPEKEYAWVDAHLDQTERALYLGSGGCLLCHAEARQKDPPGDRLPRLLPPKVPNRWWDGARFRHDAHRMLDCQQCHNALASTLSRDVLLPGIDTCLKCHDRGARRGSARADCVECHAYHDPAAQREAREGGKWAIEELRDAAK
ncbi:MAG: cytochrome c3 family protein [Gemmataceae bacterium]